MDPIHTRYAELLDAGFPSQVCLRVLSNVVARIAYDLRHL
jgi:hypothetical protein